MPILVLLKFTGFRFKLPVLETIQLNKKTKVSFKLSFLPAYFPMGIPPPSPTISFNWKIIIYLQSNDLNQKTMVRTTKWE